MKSHTAYWEKLNKYVVPAVAAIGGRIAGTVAGKAATTGAARSGTSPVVAKLTGQAVGGAVGSSVQERLRRGGSPGTDKPDTISPTAADPPNSKLAGSTFGSLSMLRKGTDALGESVQSFSEDGFYEELDRLDKNMAEFEVSSKFGPRKRKGGGRKPQLPAGSVVDLPDVPHGAKAGALTRGLTEHLAGADGELMPTTVMNTKKKGGTTFVKGELPSGQSVMSSFKPHKPKKELV